MDFHSLSRKELQALCKKNKIPANITNLAMADALAALPQVEGLDEYLNPTEGDCGSGTPDTHHRTATRRKGIKEESESSKVCSRVQRGSRAKNVEFVQDSNVNVLPVTPAVMPPTSRRRALLVSTRRKKEEEEEAEEDDDDKNGVLIQTPAALPSSRSRATGRTPRGGTTSYSTRRSVRLLEKNLSKMTLLDSEDMGPHHAVSEQELSNVSHQTQHSVETQKVNDAGASLQTVSTVVSEETDELEVSSLEKNTEYEECQSEVQLVVSGAENDVVAGLQADPQEEGLGKVNCLEAEPHDSKLKLEGISETSDDSNEVGECCDDLVVDLKKSVPIGEAVPEVEDNEAGSELSSELEGFSEPENKDCLGTKQEVLSAEVSEDAFMELTEQDVAALSVEVPGDASLEVADQCVAGSVPMSSASVDSVNLKELVEWNTDNQDNNNEDDDNKDKNNETADVNYIPNFAGDEKAADEKDLASPEGVLEKVDNASDVNRASFTVFAVEKDASFEKAEDLNGGSEKLEAKAQPEDSEEHTFDVSGASSAILGADMDANFENSTTVSEFCFESSADKSIMDAENVTVESSLLDVGVHKAEDLKDNSEILESKAQAEESEEDAAAEETALDASVLGGISNPQIPQQISVESTGNSIDSSSDALMSVLSCNSNPLVDCDVISEEIAIPKQESSVLAETEAVAPIHEQKISDIPIQSIVADQLKGESLFPVHSETEGFANEIQTVPQMINTEDNMHNVNMMKENLTTDELDKKSMAELKKMLKKLTLDGKSNCKSKTNDVVKEVEKKRTALQALPENRMTNREAHTDG